MAAFLVMVPAICLQNDPGTHFPGSPVPPRLQNIMESRSAQTSEIEWTITHYNDRDYGLVEHHTTRTSGDTRWQLNAGDSQGSHRTVFRSSIANESEEAYELAAIPKAEVAGPRHTLVYDDLVWRVEHVRGLTPIRGTLTSVERSGNYEAFDFSSAGFTPWADPATELALRGEFRNGQQDPTVASVSDGRLETIAMDYGPYRFEWDYDAQRGGQPVRAAFYRIDALIYSSETELRKVDGRWFPTEIRYYLNDDPNPSRVLEVQTATFDKPWHQKDISPSDIGVLFGTQLFQVGRGNRYWDGTSLLSDDGFKELLHLYGLRPDHRIMERMAQLIGEPVEEYEKRLDLSTEIVRARYFKKHGEAPWLLTKTDEPDEWDEYVAKFIAKHKLDEARVERAQEVLKRSKVIRDQHLRKNRKAIKKAAASGDKERSAMYEKMTKRIFDRILVRGLNRLIPKEKRQAKAP